MSEDPSFAEPNVCPSWCAHPDAVAEDHAHVSAELVVDAVGGPLVARLVCTAGADGPTVLLNDRAAAVGEARSFALGLQRLADDATLAEPGLGFVAGLAARADMGVTEMATAAGLEPSWVRAQQAGAQVLSVHEYDRLALAVAAGVGSSALGRDQD
jgi:hypothetical protein